MAQHSTGYTIGFAALVCVVCGIGVASAAVALADRQAENKKLDQQKQVLSVAGLIGEGEKLSPDDIKKRFAEEFPEIEDYGAEMNCSLAGSYFQATWPITSRPGQTQAIYVECGFTLLKSPETLNRIIDVGRGLGCALYDPQTGQRYPQP